MAGVCLAPQSDLGLVRGLLGQVDCNLQRLVVGGYDSLASPSSPVAAVLVSLLTIYVAFIGYQLLLGRMPLRIGDLTISAIKIGVVLTLATNWSAYQVLVYDFLFRAPEQLAAAVLHTVQPPGSVFRGDPFVGLQIAFDQLQTSAAAYSQHAGPIVSPSQGPGFGASATNASSLLLLAVTLGALLGSKIVLALLLAIGPVFVTFLLFDATRGLFIGWLRAMIVFAFVPLAVTLLLALQLTLIEAPLLDLAELRAKGLVDVGPAMAVLVLSFVYVAAFLCAGIAAVLLGVSLKLPTLRALGAGNVPASQESSPIPWPAFRSPRVDDRGAALAAAIVRQDRWVERSVRRDRDEREQRTLTTTLRMQGAAHDADGRTSPERRFLFTGERASTRRRDR